MTIASMLEVEADGKHLAERLAVVAGVVPSKSPRPILTDVLVEATDGRLSFTGGDSHVTVTMWADKVNVKSKGRAVVNAARLQAVIQELGGEGSMLLAVDSNGKLLVRVPGSKVALSVTSAEDYPDAPAWPAEPTATIASGDLAAAIDRTVFCLADIRGRYAMDGLLMEAPADSRDLRFVATDGKRLALVTLTLPEARRGPRLSVLLPKLAATTIAKVSRDAEQPWAVSMADGYAFFGTETCRVTARLMEGIFPPFEDVIAPKGAATRIEVKRDEFTQGLRRAALLLTKESSAVMMKFDKAEVTMTSRSPETGETEVEVPITLHGEMREAGYQPAYWGQAARFGPEALTIAVYDDTRGGHAKGPATLRWAINERMDYLYLVMPLNTAPKP